jgi:hypothetical protein
MTSLANGELTSGEGAVKPFIFRRRVIAAAALIVLLLLFFLRPGASRLKSRIISSISAGVGRSVDISSVHLRLLPRPGFDLENLVVFDDPAFGAEPMLRASEVTADLRLTSLVRGRLEIARLDLTDPSLNLVQGANGRWNVEPLLERTAHTPLAPTAKAKLEPRPGFPYIEATGARINFKSGPEKKPYALTNADFSLWQDSENEWGVRLRAQPFRTDLNLNDTGTLQVNGTWQRAAALRDTPLQFTIEWNRAQLGQLTKFFTGNDQGWRGGVLLDVALTGTPGKLQIASDASIQDFRRYDIAGGQPMRLAGHCDGQFSSTDQRFHELMCRAPVGTGSIALKGDVGLLGSGNYGLELIAENLPASAVVALARRGKKNLPEDLSGGGTLSGTFSMERDAPTAPVRVEGRGEVADLRLSSAANKTEVGPASVPFVLTSGDTSPRMPSKRAQGKGVPGMRAPDGAHVEFGPISSVGGHVDAPTVRGWIDRSGYEISVLGETEIGKALRVTRMFGIPALQSTAEGTAQVDLHVAGAWAGPGNGSASGFPGPQVTGTAKLRGVRVALRGAGGPVEISSADLQLLQNEVRVEKLIAKAAETSWTGSLEMPRGCGTPGACEVHFNLKANQIGLSEVSEWLNPRPKDRPWYRVLESSAQAGTPFLASLRASGRVTADRVLVQSFESTHVSATVSLDAGKLQVLALSAEFLGGKHRGEWRADFSAKPAVCSGSGSLTGISLEHLADAMRDPGIAGTASASYEVKGTCPAEFWSSAEGTLQFDISDGSLPHVSLTEDAGALKVARFSGKAHLRAGAVEIRDAKLDSAGGKFLVSGTASLKRELDLKLARIAAGAPAAGYTITGTVAEPKVIRSAGTETQARLKP